MEDEGDEVGYGVDDAGAQESRVCDSCGGRNLFQDANGDIVCLECGAQSQDVRQLTHEEWQGAAGSGGPGRARLVRRRMRVRKSAVLLAAHHAFNTADFVQALQHILLQHAAQVTALVGLTDDAFSVLLGGIWHRYLSKWAHSPAPMVHLIKGRVTGNGEVPYYARIAAEGMQPPPIPAVSMLLLAGMTLCACRTLHLPVHSGLLSRWCAEGHLTWLNAVGELPQDKQVTLKLAAQFFMPATAPRAPLLDRTVRLLEHSVGLGSLPGLNIPLCAASLVQEGGLPQSVLPAVMELAALDEHDRLHAAAYTKIINRSNGPGGKLTARTTPDELARLRAATDSSSGAAVAALVAVSLTMHANWEQWVDVHLFPASLGSPFLPSAGVQAGNAADEGSVSGAGAGSASAHEQKEGGRGATKGGTSLGCNGVAADMTQDRPPQPLASVRQSVLSALESSHLSTHILQGGDVAIGRGEKGYPHGLSGEAVDITVQDPLLGAALQAMDQGGSSGKDTQQPLSKDNRAALAVAAKAEVAAGRSATQQSMLALLMGSQATVPASQPVYSQPVSLYGGSQDSSLDVVGSGSASQGGLGVGVSLDDGEGEGGVQVKVKLGSRGIQPGYDTARQELWPIKQLQDVAEHANAVRHAGSVLGDSSGSGMGKAGAQSGMQAGAGASRVRQVGRAFGGAAAGAGAGAGAGTGWAGDSARGALQADGDEEEDHDQNEHEEEEEGHEDEDMAADDDDMDGVGAGTGAGSRSTGHGRGKHTPAANPSAPIPINTSLDALPGCEYMIVHPRGWQGGHRLPGRYGSFPRDAPRQHVATVRWQALLEYLASLSGVSWEEVADHADSLTLLVQLYTPLPDKPLDALKRPYKARGVSRHKAKDGECEE